MRKAKYFLVHFAMLMPLVCGADQLCNICFDTPPETNELLIGKGSSSDGENHSEKLAKAMFSGPLYYSLDGGDKMPLPAGKGVFLQIPDRKKHKIKILSENNKNWGAIHFDCAEYKHGTKIFFQNGGTYGPGWRTNPMPKNEKKCPWYPDNK